MNKKKCLQIFAGILIAVAALFYLGVFDLVEQVEFQSQSVISENNTLLYSISINLKSEGGFIQGKPVDVFIEVNKLKGGRNSLKTPITICL